MDKVFLREMTFYAYHGAFPEENRLGQRFTVDLQLGLDLRAAGQSDDLQQTVNYAEVYEVVRREVEGAPVKLVEALAEQIVKRLFAAFPVTDITIRLMKPDPPIPGHLRAVGVEITRQRSEYDCNRSSGSEQATCSVEASVRRTGKVRTDEPSCARSVSKRRQTSDTRGVGKE